MKCNKNIFFISDFHLSHKNIIKFDNRPFVDVEEMAGVLIKNWNNVVTNNDVVFYVGDLTFGRADYAKWFVNQLNGKIHFILGNHDKYNNILQMKRFESIQPYLEINVEDENVKGKNQLIVVSHYPILSWRGIHNGSFHIHGHSHGNLKYNPDYEWFYKRKVIDVSCNVIDYTPISYSNVYDIMETKIYTPIDSTNI